MTSSKKCKQTVEFGDFQTPVALASEICRLLALQGVNPASVVEPTCGTGSFLIAALDQFDNVKTALGVDISPKYVEAASSALQGCPWAEKVRIIRGDFFETRWIELLEDLPDPLLIVGNPPWVTNAELGALGSSNLPVKSNFQRYSGMDALTGKSNFDISEWMLIRMVEWLRVRRATIAMLCKTAVARKVLLHAWKNRAPLESSHIYPIDAAKTFGASVDACLVVCQFAPAARSDDCSVHVSISDPKETRKIGYRDGELIAEAGLYDRWKHLRGKERYKWRSGVKHDCAKVMELKKEGGRYRNGLGELIELEEEYVFPMLKSSDLANDQGDQPRRWMLVTQRAVGDDTTVIQHRAPKTWRYLQGHAELLDRRASTIYKDRPRFSVFGVGSYSFAPWKVAVSGLYKKLEFKVVGSFQGKPILLDDTSYFLACQNKQEAEYLTSLLNSSAAKEFFEARIFWDSKRPITIQVLRQLDLQAVAREMGTEAVLLKWLSRIPRSSDAAGSRDVQGVLFSS